MPELGEGPTLIECKTMRMLGHAIHDGAEYVPAELLSEWRERDPLDRYEAALLAQGLASHQELDAVASQCRQVVADAVEYAEQSPWPDPATVIEGIYAP